MHGNSCGCTHCQPARAPVLEAEAGFRLPLPLQAFKPRCQPFLPAKPSKNYEDYVAAPTTGRITLMINGRNSGATGADINVAEAFDSMQQVVESLKKNDTVYLAAWQFDPTVPLTLARAAGPKTWGLLLQKKAREGVKIRIIMTDFAPIATTLRAKLYQDFLPALDKLIGQLSPALRDNLKYLVSRHPATQYTIHVATHHQKFMVVKKSGATIAFCGGLDISYLRTPAYWNAPNYPWLWHDIHARLEGRIARDLEFEFIQRWNREKSASVVKALKGWRAFDTLTQGASGALDRMPVNNTQQLQMLRTVSFQGAGRNIQNIKRDDIWQAYLRLIGCASRFIFLENQYFREPRMADAIVRQAKLHPQLIVIVIVPEQLDDPDDPIKRHGNWLQHAFFTRLFAGIAPHRLRVFTMFHRIIHSKLMLADDKVLCMGSANANPRGFFLDTELNVVLDDVDGVTRFRQRLWAHELGVPESTLATWKVADFIARWDAVANANQGIKKRPDDVAGEGVTPFDPRREKGQQHAHIADVLTEAEALEVPPPLESNMHQKQCHCSACAGGFEVMAFAPQGGAGLLNEAEESEAEENEAEAPQFESGRGAGAGAGPSKRCPVVLPALTIRDRPFVVLENFAFNDPAMPARYAPIIARIARLVVASQISGEPIDSIRLVGHTDPSGSDAFNLDLAKRRAHSVETALRAAVQALGQVPAGTLTIVVQTLGEARPVAPNDSAAGRARNRRVEVFIPITCSSFFAQYDLRFLPGDALFGIPAHPNLNAAQQALRSADVNAMVGELLARRDRRASEALAARVPAPRALPPGALRNRAQRLSAAQLALFREYFADGRGGILFGAFQTCFERFANGQLRSPISADQAKGVGEPNGDFFFLFAEFAFLCIASRIDAALWTHALRSFVKAQEIFMHVYRPAPVSPPPAVGAAVPACPRDAQGRVQLRRQLDSYGNGNFRASGASPTVGAGQSGPARIRALAAKYAGLDAGALQRQAQANLLRAQCMP